MKLLINASNLHGGGGVQVAASFIYELSKLHDIHTKHSVSVVCSKTVERSLPKSFDRTVFAKFDVTDIRGIKRPTKMQLSLFIGHQRCFTVFGPIYFKIPVDKHVCGFAQPWIAYPNNKAYEKLSLKEKISSKLKYAAQEYLFKKYDTLVVEAEHVKDALISKGYSMPIHVVSNTISSVFEGGVSKTMLSHVDKQGDFFIGFLGRPYKHKNIETLRTVNQILINQFELKVDFLFTLSKEEMDRCGFSSIENFLSVGEISLNECPSFYNTIDALIFPTLLECFSATPIEAMKMGVPVIGSHSPFVSNFCKDAAFYFDPMDANDIARAILEAVNNPELRKEKIALGYEIANSLPTAKDRARTYIDILTR